MSSRGSLADHNQPIFRRCLEVIVTSVADAQAAEQGGADRLELVRNLQLGGLTPDLQTVGAVLAAVSIPVRVMLRETGSMQVAGPAEMQTLQLATQAFARLPIDGLVLGWVTKNGELDEASLGTVLAAAEGCPVTFHRAFEHLADPLAGLDLLKKNYPQVDRVLTNGGQGPWEERKRRLLCWSEAASPAIKIMAGGDLSEEMVRELMAEDVVTEIHVGRAVRRPHEYDGEIDSGRIAALKKYWQQ